MIKLNTIKNEVSLATFKYSDLDVVKVALIGSTKYLVFKLHNKATFSCKLPNCVSIKHNAEGLELTSSDSVTSLGKMLSDIQSKISAKDVVKQAVYRMRVKMLGLGFKCYKSKDLSILKIRAGFSHLVKVIVPKCIVSVKPSKSALVIESVDKTALGNFVNRILRVKPADSYKARGFSPRYRIRPLKIVKKK